MPWRWTIDACTADVIRTWKDTHEGGGRMFLITQTFLLYFTAWLSRWIVSADITVLWFYNQRGMYITCEFCVKDLFVLLPDLLLVVFKQPLTQVAHLLQRKRRLVLPWGTWETLKKKSGQLWKRWIIHIRGAVISHRDWHALSPEIGAQPGASLQLCYQWSLTSASQQGHAALMRALSRVSCLCLSATGATFS